MVGNTTYFSERIAERYDVTEEAMYDEAVLTPMVNLLCQLAGGGPVLEFAIGTGRVALPLQNQGLDVHGIEFSQPMIDVLRRKPGGEQMPVIQGDMASAQAGRDFQLVYLVYNTITNLTSQDAQVECFCNAATHLRPGGLFLIEVELPVLHKVPVAEPYAVFDLTSEHVGIDEYDRANQLLTSHHLWFDGDQIEKFNSVHRYAWPAEYDLMARIAGMTLQNRWADWLQNPFTGTSHSHISVWKKT